MTISEKPRKGYGRLLDAWQPPADAGDPVGCLATSFTFAPDFFEEECLSRFLHLDSDPRQDPQCYLVEREEKLYQVRCAAALVDQHHCQGTRSLRWDLLPIRVGGGFLHAKVSLLCWNKLIRVIIASANLTEDGYRRNQEVFGVVEFRPNRSDAARDFLDSTIEFLREVLQCSLVAGSQPSPAVGRCEKLLSVIHRRGREWKIPESLSHRRATSLTPLFVGGKRPNVFESLNVLWSGQGRPAWAHVYSPFFDSPSTRNQPADHLWQFLKQRGEAETMYYVVADEIATNGGLALHAPESLLKAEPQGRANISTEFFRIVSEGDRSFHAKGIWLENERLISYLIGSSNFTSRGLGLSGTRSNFEANLVYTVRLRRKDSAWKRLDDAFPKYEKIDEDEKLIWQPPPEQDENVPEEYVPLPACFSTAIFHLDEKSNGWVDLQLNDQPPKGWTLYSEDKEQPLDLEGCGVVGVENPTFKLPWVHPRPPSGFWVKWNGVSGRAWWPVIAESVAALPPPDELRNLPLDVLVDILTSSRPLHAVLRSFLNRREKPGGNGRDHSDVITDSHRKVDTSRFLLQRTRRVSWALAGLRKRLERPVTTETCLQWRLTGPVGVRALEKALIREAHSDEERVFLLTELAFELTRCRPQTAAGCLATAPVKQAIHKHAAEIIAGIASMDKENNSTVRSYVDRVFAEIQK